MTPAGRSGSRSSIPLRVPTAPPLPATPGSTGLTRPEGLAGRAGPPTPSTSDTIPRRRPYSAFVSATANPSNSTGELRAFRAVAYIEAVTYLVLLAAVVLYRVLDGPDFI